MRGRHDLPSSPRQHTHAVFSAHANRLSAVSLRHHPGGEQDSAQLLALFTGGRCLRATTGSAGGKNCYDTMRTNPYCIGVYTDEREQEEAAPTYADVDAFWCKSAR